MSRHSASLALWLARQLGKAGICGAQNEGSPKIAQRPSLRLAIALAFAVIPVTMIE
jgi:hypothetical protein